MYKVLLVDDERIIVEGIAKIIKEFDLGFNKFLIVDDGKDALLELENFKPDVILTDIRMPFIDGLTLSQKVRARKDELKDIPIIILTGYSDFEYAKKAIEYEVQGYLLKPIDKRELYSVLLKTKNLIDAKAASVVHHSYPFLLNEHILQKIIGDRRAFLHDYMHGTAAAQISDIEYDGFFIVCFVFEELNAINGDIPCDYYKHLEFCFERLKDNVISTIVLGATFLCLVGAKKDPGIHNKFYNSPDFERYIKDNNIKVIISSFVKKAECLFTAYHQVNLVLEYKKLMPESRILTYDDISSFNKKGPLDLKEIKHILDAIEEGNLESIAKQLDLIKMFLLSNKNFTLNYIECVYSLLCMEIYKRFYSLTLYNKMTAYFEFFLAIKDTIRKSKSIMDIHSKVRERIFSFCIDYNKEKNNDINNKDIIAAAKDLIDKDFHKPEMSLKYLSSRLYISSSYLSTCFKKQLGISFNEYLCKIRVAKAIDILNDPKIPISKIGSMVGYTSEKHFFTVFKKHTGISPAKYRFKKSMKHLVKNAN